MTDPSDQDGLGGKHRHTTIMARIANERAVETSGAAGAVDEGGGGRVALGGANLTAAATRDTPASRTDEAGPPSVVVAEPDAAPTRGEPPAAEDAPSERAEPGRSLPHLAAEPSAEHSGAGDGRVDVRPAPGWVLRPLTGKRPRRGGPVVGGVAVLLGLGFAALLVILAFTVDLPASSMVGYGEQIKRPDGWRVRVDRPAPVTGSVGLTLPADADRAVRIEITLTNDGSFSRESAGWTVKATADGRPVEPLLVEGRRGDQAPSRTILPGSSLSFTVIVPMPNEETDLHLEAAPPDEPPTIFFGSA
jgi:hypothetical protein